MTTTSSERRLHPVSILFDAARTISQAALPFIALLFTATREGRAQLIIFAIIGGLASLLGVMHVLRYLRYTYRYDERDLVIRSGLLHRNERRIPYARIQNLDATQSIVHRLFGVAVVYVQTGGGSTPEATLRVLPRAAVDDMRARVLAAGGATAAAASEITRTEPDIPTISGADAEAAGQIIEPDVATPTTPEPPRRTLLALAPRDLLLAGFIENRGMLLIFAVLAIIDRANITEQLIERVFDIEDTGLGEMIGRYVSDVTLVEGAAYLAAVALFLLLFVRVLSTIWALVRLYGFRLERAGEDLHMQYGLFTRVTATIPLRRVQTIIIEDRLLHRMVDRVRVKVTTAGGLAQMGNASLREPIAPILRAEALPALLNEIQPGLTLDDLEWRPVHPRAFGRMVRKPLFFSAISLTAYFVIGAWSIAIFLLLGAGAVLHARLRSRYAAWTVTGDSFMVRDGGLKRQLRIARFSRIQVTQLLRTPFDRRAGMAVIRADTAGAGAVTARFVPETAAATLHGQLTDRTAATGFSW